ncbi:hypothetical protein ES702_01408 [subsurface metagenome]
MPTALFFRPNKDLALQYGSAWLRLGVEEATKRGFNVIDVVDEAATFDTLKGILETERIDVVILLGHGNASTFTGFEQRVVFRACQNDEVMSGTISHFLSCSVGQQLLPSIIEKKGVWTVGYQVDFNFMIEPPEAVEPFRDITLAIITKILDGGKLKEVWDAGINMGKAWVAKLWDRPEIWCAEAIQLINHDIQGLIGLGSEEAYITPARMAPSQMGGLLLLSGLTLVLLTG